MNPLAIRPRLFPPSYIAWDVKIFRSSAIRINSGVGTAISGESLPHHIEVTLEDGAVYKLALLTVDLSNKKLRQHVARCGRLHFKSNAEISKFYLEEVLFY